MEPGRRCVFPPLTVDSLAKPLCFDVIFVIAEMRPLQHREVATRKRQGVATFGFVGYNSFLVSFETRLICDIWVRRVVRCLCRSDGVRV